MTSISSTESASLESTTGNGALTQNQLKALVGQAALQYVVPGEVIGVGTGSTVNYFIDALATIKSQIKGAVSSSVVSTQRLQALGICLLYTSPSPRD